MNEALKYGLKDPINPSQAENHKPGQAVTVTALILSFEKENQATIVKLGSGKVE